MDGRTELVVAQQVRAAVRIGQLADRAGQDYPGAWVVIAHEGRLCLIRRHDGDDWFNRDEAELPAVVAAARAAGREVVVVRYIREPLAVLPPAARWWSDPTPHPLAFPKVGPQPKR